MRKVTDMPTSLAEALHILDGKVERTIANNTRLRRLASGRVAVVLHSTEVVTFTPEGTIILNSGGYRSVTTKARMNACLRTTGYGVSQQKWGWYVIDRWTTVRTTAAGPVHFAEDFTDGITLPLDREG